MKIHNKVLAIILIVMAFIISTDTSPQPFYANSEKEQYFFLVKTDPGFGWAIKEYLKGNG